MHITVEMLDQFRFVRVGLGEVLLKPVKADKLQMLVIAGHKAFELLVDHPLDGCQPVVEVREIFRYAVAVHIPEPGLRFDGVHTSQEDARLIAAVLRTEPCFHLTDSLVECIYVVTVEKHIVNKKLPVRKICRVRVVAVGLAAAWRSRHAGKKEKGIEKCIAQYSVVIVITDAADSLPLSAGRMTNRCS